MNSGINLAHTQFSYASPKALCDNITSRLTNISHTTRYSHNLLQFAFSDQWKESVDGFEDAHNINLEALLRIFQDGWHVMFAGYNGISNLIQKILSSIVWLTSL